MACCGQAALTYLVSVSVSWGVIWVPCHSCGGGGEHLVGGFLGAVHGSTGAVPGALPVLGPPHPVAPGRQPVELPALRTGRADPVITEAVELAVDIDVRGVFGSPGDHLGS